MLTGEYFVLDGALSLAIPTKLGQSMAVTPSDDNEATTLSWRSYDNNGELWYSQNFEINRAERKVGVEEEVGCEIDPTTHQLSQLLNEAMRLNTQFLTEGSWKVETHLDFPSNWGLGSSSTLICNIAKWAEVDAFDLLDVSFGGSGYDIAVGMQGGDVLYRNPELWEGFVFNPSFIPQLYFIHLNTKQNSREGIKAYKAQPQNNERIQRISEITDRVSVVEDLDEFQELISEHEQIVADHLGMRTVKDMYFSDYPYAIKSLGAWGGDFILAVGDANTPQYFKDRGYELVLPFDNLIKL